jgi:hypothetical protein
MMLLAAGLGGPRRAVGQVVPEPAAPSVSAADASRPAVSPGRAFLQSLVIPGFAQAKLDRPAGLLFATVEAVALTMLAKSSYDYRLARSFSQDSTPARYALDPATGLPQRDPATGDPLVSEWNGPRYTAERLRARRTHIEDWRALLIFNHLLSGADAYISAQLWDLPGKVDLRVAPGRRVVGWSIPW